MTDLPAYVSETEPGVFLWSRIPIETQDNGRRIFHEPSRLCCAHRHGTTLEELEAIVAILRERQFGGTPDERPSGVSPDAPEPSAPAAKRRGRPPKNTEPATP